MEALSLGMLGWTSGQTSSGTSSRLTSLSPSPVLTAHPNEADMPVPTEPGAAADEVEPVDGDPRPSQAAVVEESTPKSRVKNIARAVDKPADMLTVKRESVRVRINKEYPKATRTPGCLTSPTVITKKSTGKRKLEETFCANDVPSGSNEREEVVVEKPKKRNKAIRARKQSSGRTTKKTRTKGDVESSVSGARLDTAAHTARVLVGKVNKRPKKVEIGEEIVAIPPGSHFSLESMSHSEPFDAPVASNAESVLQHGKKAKRSSRRQAQLLTGTRPSTSGTSETENERARVKGIKSSTFARVMRLVADITPPQSTTRLQKRSRAAHRPPVWAESRQELCEALPYYRAFQSGLYMYQGVAFGYLLDGFPAPRDVCAHNARVIISHGGGQCIRPLTKEGKKLPPVLAGDQLTTDARVATLVRAWQRRTPLVLIAGSGYALLPFKLDCAYAVLGWYWVSHVWTEAEPVAQGVRKSAGRDWYKRVKVRFDWIDSQGAPWWEQAKERPPTQVIPTVDQTLEAKCIAVSALMEKENVTERPLSRTASSSSSSSGSPSEYDDGSRQSDTLPSGKSRRRRRKLDSVQITPIDPLTGLLTPPITPPLAGRSDAPDFVSDRHAIRDAAATCIPDPPFSSDMAKVIRRRLPGDHRLAAIRDSVERCDDAQSLPMPSRLCRYCGQQSPVMYREGWICMTTVCSAYWLLDTSIGLLPIPPGFKLSYDLAFLAHLPTPVIVKPPYDIVPPQPKQGIPDEAGPSDSAGSRSLWRGWVCDNCGRANCRFRWEVWQCLSCKRLLAPINPYTHTISTRSVRSTHHAVLGDPVIHPQSGITTEMRRVTDPSATIMIYRLPDGGGTIFHFINDSTEFADGIFDRYQREAASTRVPLFQRRPLNNHQIRGQLLAQHFAVNSGASYKYNVDSLSLSFDESPSCVIQALDAITLRTAKVVGHGVDFNEILSVLYREGQKMSWHDDGEPGLGPVVAGLSLGSAAVISWRRKSARSPGSGQNSSGQPASRKDGKPPIALSLTTSHGDIVMMQGREMQKKYQHRVIPSGFRVAATARVIGK